MYKYRNHGRVSKPRRESMGDLGWWVLGLTLILALALIVPAANAAVTPADRFITTQITDRDVEVGTVVFFRSEKGHPMLGQTMDRRFKLPDADGNRRFKLPDADGN